MLVLGWHGSPLSRESHEVRGFSFHDAAAAIFRDGVLVAAIEEERLNRIKHSSVFPTRAIRFCLQQVGARLRDVDIIVTDLSEEFFDFALLQEAVSDPRSSKQTARELLSSVFEEEFQEAIGPRLRFCKHHIAHLYGTWIPSGFSEALAVCIDGDGDGAAGLICHCEGERYRVLRTIPEALSLGKFYADQLPLLGYRRFDEYKVMGLAPYGNPRTYEALFQQMYRLTSAGRYEILSDLERLVLMKEAGLTAKMRRKGEPFEGVHKDFAAALQLSLERIVGHVLEHFQVTTGLRNLCLSGGVAHNCTMNGHVLRSKRFDHVYVQPAAHDAGNAVGAALAALYENGHRAAAGAMRHHVYLGSDIARNADLEAQLKSWAPLISHERIDQASRVAAEILAAGRVLGWVQGRSEFGPRALGNRSILADPRPAQNKQIINAMVKKREDYRPFAPSVLQDRVGEFFEVPSQDSDFPFMVMTLQVRPEKRSVLGAITHIDGSARVQSVSRRVNPLYHALIEEFDKLTGVPIVLNTSFNNNVEPIVDSVEDAIVTFLTTGIHALIIGDYLISKREGAQLAQATLDLSASVRPTHKLVRRVSSSGGESFAIESNYDEPAVSVSAELFQVLLRATPAATLRQTCHELGVAEPDTQGGLGPELLRLWALRALRLHPPSVKIAPQRGTATALG